MSSISGFVWLDNNGDGDRDLPGDLGIAGVTIELLLNGIFFLTTVSNALGGYDFSGLPNGDYTVRIAPSNYNPGGPLQGFNPTFDADGNVTANSASFALGSSFEDRTGIDFGYAPNNHAPTISLPNALDIVAPNLDSSSIAVFLGDGAGGFGSALVTPSTGTRPFVPVLSDFNEDGVLDLAIANNNGVSVQIGNGDGTFSAGVLLGNGSSLAAGDINGDGHVDLVASDENDEIFIYLGDGTGAFAPAGSLAVDTAAQLALGDIDGDDDLDIVGASYGDTNGAVLLLNNGDGTFGAASVLPTGGTSGGQPITAKLADLNGDGSLDIVLADRYDGLFVYLNNGNGTYAPPTGILVGAMVSDSVDVGDINGDGTRDLVAIGQDPNSLLIFIGNGDGTFAPEVNVALGTLAWHVKLADIDGDGNLDAVFGTQNDTAVGIMLGNGDGTFGAQTYLQTGGTSPAIPVVGELNRRVTTPEDTALVFSAANGNAVTVNDVDGGGLTVTLSVQSGALTLSTLAGLTFTAGDGTSDKAMTFTGLVADVKAALDGLTYVPKPDFNGGETLTVMVVDGGLQETSRSLEFEVTPVNDAPFLVLKPADDLLVLNRAGNSLSVLLGDGAGIFAETAGSPIAAVPNLIALAGGDLNGDGYLDAVVTVGGASDHVRVLLGNGMGGFAMAGSPLAVGDGPISIAIGDLDGDGVLDIVTANRNTDNVSVLFGNGDGSFAAAKSFAAGDDAYGLALGDLDGDGFLDIVVTNYTGAGTSILFNDGSGGFGSRILLASGGVSNAVALGDIDGDGDLDIAVSNINNDRISILLGIGHGLFGTPTSVSVGDGPISVVLADLNGDGDLDLITANSLGNSVSLRFGNGSGGFSAGIDYGVGTNPLQVVVHDVDGDGDLDIATANSDGDSVTLLLNNGGGGFSAASGSPIRTGDGPARLLFGDFDQLNEMTDTVAFTEGDTTQLMPFIIASDKDNMTFDGATLTIGGGFVGSGDVLDAVTAGTNITATFNPATGVLSLTGTDTIDNYLQVLRTVTFVSGEDPTNAGANTSRTVTVTVNDGGTGGVSNAGTVTINITAQNDAPVITVPPSVAVVEDVASALTGISFADVDAGSGNVGVALSVIPGQGTLAAAASGSVIVFNDGTNISLIGSIADINAYIAAGNVTYTTAPNANGSVTLGIAISDEGHTGGPKNEVFAGTTLVITPVNDAPTTTPVTLTAIVEDSGPRLITQAELLANASDIDNSNAQLSATGLTIASGSGTLTDNGNGTWTYTPALNDDTAASFSYTVTDGALTAVGSATLDITPVNDAPVITSNGGGNTATIDIAENTTAVTTVVATDPDGPSLTYSIVGGSDAARFKINAATGALSFINAPDFEVKLDSDANNSYVVQVRASDGTLADDQTITVNVTNVINELGKPFDFNADGKGDILFQNSNGSVAAWLLDGTGLMAMGGLLPNPNANSGAGAPILWKAIGSADFNGDSKSDILWQHVDGTAAVWLMDSTGVMAMGAPLPNPGPTWHAKEAADFNGDGKADILWQNDNGAAAVWLMNGTNVQAYGAALPNPGPTWHEKAAADFNGDGKADILWQNDNGAAAVWLMDGTSVLQSGAALPNPGPSWHAQAAGDFNGDGKADILWQNDSGAAAVWLMDGTNVISMGAALPNPGPTWHVKEAIDTNADGMADILWQNDNGTPAVWLMNGTSVLQSGAALTNPGAAWHIV